MTDPEIVRETRPVWAEWVINLLLVLCSVNMAIMFGLKNANIIDTCGIFRGLVATGIVMWPIIPAMIIASKLPRHRFAAR